MSDAPLSPVSTTAAEASRRLLTLARKDRSAAAAAFEALSVEAQIALICETPISLRLRMLALADDPAVVVPHLPEAELCFIVKSGGVEDASWILAHATPSQVTACFDLDAWKGMEPDRSALDRWIATLAEAGEDPLCQAVQTLDPELLVLYLRDHIEVALDPNDDDWLPPPGAHTLEGQFYLLPKRQGDDIDGVLALLHSIFVKDYWLYFRLLQACIWELDGELEEWALRWRSGRLEDLGFPSWDESMRIYGYLRPEKRSEIADAAIPVSAPRWNLPVWLPSLPEGVQSTHSLFIAIAALDETERASAFYAFVALANKVAVADKLELGDAETLPKAIEKAAATASRGLEWLVAEHSIAAADVLRRASLDRLFRVGASLMRGDDAPLIPK